MPSPGLKYVAFALLNGAVGWMSAIVLDIIKLLWGMLSATAFTTPDVSELPQVAAIVNTSMTVVNVCFILAIISAGIVVMASAAVQTRYGVGELLPRLVVGWIAANFAIPICRQLVQVADALTEALTGDGVNSQTSLDHLRQVTADSLSNPKIAFLAVIIGLLIAVLTSMLMVTWLVRIGVLIVLVGVSPVALACHATPFTDGVARLWWRSMLATLATVVLQAVALHTALVVFLSPTANLPALGIPHDPTGTLNLLIIVCLLWVVIKIPSMMRRYVTRGGGGNVGGMIVRMVLVQQLTGMLRAPRLARARTASAASGARSVGAGGARGGAPGGGGRLPQPVGGGRGRGSIPARADAEGRAPLSAPRGAGPGRVGVAWPTGRPVPPYTPQELADGVDPYTATVRRAPTTPRPQQPRSTRPPIRAAGVQPTTPAGPRPVLSPEVNPATVMPPTRPVRPPVRGSWNRPPRRR